MFDVYQYLLSWVSLLWIESSTFTSFAHFTREHKWLSPCSYWIFLIVRCLTHLCHKHSAAIRKIKVGPYLKSIPKKCLFCLSLNQKTQDSLTDKRMTSGTWTAKGCRRIYKGCLARIIPNTFCPWAGDLKNLFCRYLDSWGQRKAQILVMLLSDWSSHPSAIENPGIVLARLRRTFSLLSRLCIP